MSYQTNQEIIKNFLKQVQNKLPGWLKDKKEECNEVLNELEMHILDKAKEISEGREPNAYDIQKAIDSMGSPSNIANEYKKRGTPKVFISQELWPWYVKGIQIILAIVITINMIGFVFQAITGNFGEAFASLWSGVWGGFMWGAVIVTIIFVVFSMEGFLPEDFDEGIKKSKKTRSESIKFEHKKAKSPLSRGEFMFGGMAAVIVGVFMMTMPVAFINEYLGPVMVEWINIAGIFTLFGGFISLIQALLGMEAVNAQRVLFGLSKLLDILFLPRALMIGDVLKTIPSIVGLEPEILEVVTMVFDHLYLLVILGFVIGMIEMVYKIITLRSKVIEYQKQSNN